MNRKASTSRDIAVMLIDTLVTSLVDKLGVTEENVQIERNKDSVVGNIKLDIDSGIPFRKIVCDIVITHDLIE